MARAAMMVADGTEPIEAVAPTDALRRGGVEVTLVSVMGRLDLTAAHDVHVRADALVEDVDLGAFDMIVMPGGALGVENLGKSEKLAEALRSFAAQGKLIGAICAAPMILAKLGLLDGRKATCYPGCETDFPDGVYQDVRGVVEDGTIITASGPGQALPFGIALLRALHGSEAADAVASDMLLI